MTPEQSIKNIIEWAIRTFGFDLAYQKADANFKELTEEYLNYLIDLKNRVETDKRQKSIISNEMFKCYIIDSNSPKFI
jgi:hypothetical protein